MKEAQCASVLAQTKILVMPVFNLSIKDDIPVYRDMLSVSTLDINFRILLNFII